MEFWLKKSDNEKLQLPVPPSKYSITESVNSSTVNVLGLGEISFIGSAKLFAIPAIESFFPNQNYSFCQYTGFPSPQECVDLLSKWMSEGSVIRYIVTGTKLNIQCTIDSFQYGEEDGSGNITFTLQLKEYRKIANIAQTGWISSGGSWYYFDSNGSKKTGWVTDNDKKYYLRDNGTMATGWLQDNGKWYYLNNNGSMASQQWITWNGKEYYLNSDGTMAANTYIGKWYVGSDGAWVGNG